MAVCQATEAEKRRAILAIPGVLDCRFEGERLRVLVADEPLRRGLETLLQSEAAGLDVAVERADEDGGEGGGRDTLDASEFLL